MRTLLPASVPSTLALALFLAGAAHAQQAHAMPADANALASATVTSNVPPRAGEASTMTNGIPNLLTSNVQPGELGIQTRLTVRKHASVLASSPDLRVMGASSAPRPD
jgi:hypothetical protein